MTVTIRALKYNILRSYDRLKVANFVRRVYFVFFAFIFF